MGLKMMSSWKFWTELKGLSGSEIFSLPTLTPTRCPSISSTSTSRSSKRSMKWITIFAPSAKKKKNIRRTDRLISPKEEKTATKSANAANTVPKAKTSAKKLVSTVENSIRRLMKSVGAFGKRQKAAHWRRKHVLSTSDGSSGKGFGKERKKRSKTEKKEKDKSLSM